jgi:hypothetical protein
MPSAAPPGSLRWTVRGRSVLSAPGGPALSADSLEVSPASQIADAAKIPPRMLLDETLVGLDWLVDRRNQIQSLMLAISKHRPPPEATTQSRDWQLCVGAAFSLWRAVFLVDKDRTQRPLKDTEKAAANFLGRVVETNAITFADDHHAERKDWTVGYYLNNARFRLERLRGHDPAASIIDMETRVAWDRLFLALSTHADGLQRET